MEPICEGMGYTEQIRDTLFLSSRWEGCILLFVTRERMVNEKGYVKTDCETRSGYLKRLSYLFRRET